MAKIGGGSSPTGIRGVITPASTLSVIHLERDGTVIQVFGPGSTEYTFTDSLPLDNTSRTYDFYETRTGYQQSADSSTVSGKPTTLSAL